MKNEKIDTSWRVGEEVGQIGGMNIEKEKNREREGERERNIEGERKSKR